MREPTEQIKPDDPVWMETRRFALHELPPSMQRQLKIKKKSWTDYVVDGALRAALLIVVLLLVACAFTFKR
jgi:hypothetical protein